MNWALEMLGLEADADERAIKRAYARLLRSNRPDDDPTAFQRLHEAYQTALHWSRFHKQELECAADDETSTMDAEDLVRDKPQWQGTDTPDAGSADCRRAPLSQISVQPAGLDESSPHWGVIDEPAVVTTPPPIDIEALAEQICRNACNLSTDTFTQWLRECPELWSLAAKEDVARQLAIRLFNQDKDAISQNNFDMIADTFNWHDVGGPLDTDVLALLRQRLHVRWIVMPGNEAELRKRLSQFERTNISIEEARKRRHLLTRPWDDFSVLRDAIMPSRVIAMKNTLLALTLGEQPPPCPPLRRDQVAFWRDASNEQQLTTARMHIGLLRGLIFSSAWLLLCVGMHVCRSFASMRSNRPEPSFDSMLPMAVLGVAACMAIGMGVLPWKLLWRWVSAPRLTRVWLPMLALLALMNSRSILGMAVGGFSLLAAIRFVWRQFPDLINHFILAMVPIFIVFQFLVSGMNISYVGVFASIALFLCLFELGTTYRRSRRAAGR